MVKNLSVKHFQYGCICEGKTDTNGEFTDNKNAKDILQYYFGDCTIIETSISITDLPVDYDLEEIFEDIEEVYGFVSFFETKLSEVVFKNLKIIRGWQKKHITLTGYVTDVNERG